MIKINVGILEIGLKSHILAAPNHHARGVWWHEALR